MGKLLSHDYANDPSEDWPTVMTRGEARQAGEKRFFTGRPCKRGHIALMQVCSGCIACQKAYQQSEKGKSYRQTDKYKASQKANRQTDKYKAKRKAKRQTDEYKIHMAAYRQTERHKNRTKELKKVYRQTEKYYSYQKPYMKAYRQSEKGKETIKAYNQSESGKTRIKKFTQSEKGTAAFVRYELKKQLGLDFTPDIPAEYIAARHQQVLLKRQLKSMNEA